jgi:outer membrane protein
LGLQLNPAVSESLGHVSAGAPTDRWRYTAGLGVAVVPDYEGSNDYELAPLPVARIQRGYRYGQLFGLKLTSNLLQHPNFRVGPVVNYRPSRDNVENNQVDQQKNIGQVLELGVQVGYELGLDGGILGAKVEVVVDAIDGHDGWLFTPEINYRRPLGERWNMSLATSVTYATDHYMNTYFSVDPRLSAKSGLPKYDASADLKDVGLNIALGYEITESWGLGMIGGYKRLLREAENSPITQVGSANQFIAGVFLTYSWSSR